MAASRREIGAARGAPRTASCASGRCATSCWRACRSLTIATLGQTCKALRRLVYSDDFAKLRKTLGFEESGLLLLAKPMDEPIAESLIKSRSCV